MSKEDYVELMRLLGLLRYMNATSNALNDREKVKLEKAITTITSEVYV